MRDQDAIRDHYKVVLQDLREQKSYHESKLREIDAAISALELLTGDASAGSISSGQAKETGRPPDVKVSPPAEEALWAKFSSETLHGVCRGKSMPDGAIALIRLLGKPLTEDEIVDGLRKGGVIFVSDQPALTLRFALLRKRRDVGVLFQTEDKRWDLTDSADDDGESVSSGFVQNRDRNEHAERSRKGLLAARERGVKNGRRSIITPDLRRKVADLLAKGLSHREVARQVGTAQVTISRWVSKGVLEDVEPASGGPKSG